MRFGRRPDRKTVGYVLSEEPIPLRFVRRFAPYYEIPEGWSAKAIAGYLRKPRRNIWAA